MSDISIRKTGCAGRITLTRPEALNAMTYDMALAIEAALIDWATDDDVALVVIDAEGERAFCSGGDIQEMYRTGMAGDYEYGRRFWRDEYRLNARIATYPKPYVALCQGFTMGGGVGISLLGSHRIVGDSAQIAMPECGIGLVPDVGGSLLLARAPGHAGEYLGLSGARMGPGDAIWAGFADHYVPEADWPDLIALLEKEGDVAAIPRHPAPASEIADHAAVIDKIFGLASLASIHEALTGEMIAWTDKVAKSFKRVSPLSMACALDLIRAARKQDSIEAALQGEYRYTWRCMEHGDFLEGIRAQVIDRDRMPVWRHPHPMQVKRAEVDAMLASLGADELELAL